MYSDRRLLPTQVIEPLFIAKSTSILEGINCFVIIPLFFAILGHDTPPMLTPVSTSKRKMLCYIKYYIKTNFGKNSAYL